MRPRCAVLLAAVAMGGALSACGADDELSSDIPRTTPDLTIPTATTELPPDDASTTSTTSTTTTATTPAGGAVTPPSAAAPAAPVTPPAPVPQAPATGGAGTDTGTQEPPTGGAQAGDGDFQNFCRDNPGAGPPC